MGKPSKASMYRNKLGGWKLYPPGHFEQFVAERRAEREKVETFGTMSPEKKAEMQRLYGKP